MKLYKRIAYIIAGFAIGLCIVWIKNMPSFEVTDQVPSNAVVINKLRLKIGGYVVVEALTGNNTPVLIGLSDYLPKGDYNTLHVELFDERNRRDYQRGSKYRISIHADNGDKFFDASHDFPMKILNGEVMQKTIVLL